MNKLTRFNLGLAVADTLGAVMIGAVLYRRYRADKLNIRRKDREHGKQFTCEALVNIIDADTMADAHYKNHVVFVAVSSESDALKNWEKVHRIIVQRKLSHHLVPVEVVYKTGNVNVAVVRSDQQFAKLTKYM